MQRSSTISQVLVDRFDVEKGPSFFIIIVWEDIAFEGNEPCI
jgi:hypothetical protein